MNTKFLYSVFFLMGFNCTSGPNGAISYNSMTYYLNDRFHEDIPEEFIFKTWGYRIIDYIDKEHTYKSRISIPHNRKQIHWCSIHRQHEVVKAFYHNGSYVYHVSKHKKSL